MRIKSFKTPEQEDQKNKSQQKARNSEALTINSLIFFHLFCSPCRLSLNNRFLSLSNFLFFALFILKKTFFLISKIFHEFNS